MEWYLIEIAQECHVKGPYLMSHYFIKRFGAKGTIINFSSLAIGLVMPGLSAHSASELAMAKTSEYLQKGRLWDLPPLGMD